MSRKRSNTLWIVLFELSSCFDSDGFILVLLLGFISLFFLFYFVEQGKKNHPYNISLFGVNTSLKKVQKLGTVIDKSKIPHQRFCLFVSKSDA